MEDENITINSKHFGRSSYVFLAVNVLLASFVESLLGIQQNDVVRQYSCRVLVALAAFSALTAFFLIVISIIFSVNKRNNVRAIYFYSIPVVSIALSGLMLILYALPPHKALWSGEFITTQLPYIICPFVLCIILSFLSILLTPQKPFMEKSFEDNKK